MNTIVATNGCFDILHAGHVHLLQQARRMGCALVVGVNSDEAVRVLKGNGRPLQPFAQRALVLHELRCVDLVIEVPSVNMVQFLTNVRPAVWVKGGDYTIDTLNQDEVAVANALGCRIAFVPELYKIHTNGLFRPCVTPTTDQRP